MESILKKFENDSIDLSQIYGAEDVSTGRGLYGSAGGPTLTGSEFAIFDGECCAIYFMSDTGERHLISVQC